MRVLIVEDEERLARNIEEGIAKVAGFAVDIAHDGEDGLHLAMSNEYDAILLDLMLPQLSGKALLASLRRAGRKTPVLVLTAVEDKKSTVELLNAGADDYLSKPFDLGELLARLKALIRRSQGHATPRFTTADLELDMNTRTVRRKGAVIDVTPMEYRVLEYLMARSEAVVSKTELLEHLYDYNWEKFSNVLEVFISGLRRKIDRDGWPKLIHTVRGHGYVVRGHKR
ncbi:MAG TPA: response regulator transcription factor [Candidatus Angelobacter sp.]|nr:response regulator transcription factor [Candidatus Angelobacter sp.]